MAVVNIANGFGSWRDCDIGSGAGVRRQFLEQHLETRVSTTCEEDSGRRSESAGVNAGVNARMVRLASRA